MKTTRREFLKKSLQGTLAAIWGTAAAKGIKLPEVEEEKAIQQGGASIRTHPSEEGIQEPHPTKPGEFVTIGEINRDESLQLSPELEPYYTNWIPESHPNCPCCLDYQEPDQRYMPIAPNRNG